MIYLDNNATTIMPQEVRVAMLDWCNRGNPSSGYASAIEARTMMDAFRAEILTASGLTPGTLCPSSPRLGPTLGSTPTYEVIFTSSASESNCTVLHSVTHAWAETVGRVPHVVISAIEHKSLHDMAKSYEARGLITCTWIAPEPTGVIDPGRVAVAITRDTCLVCVMHANNETGAINNIARIGEIAHAQNVPVLADCVHTFGRYVISEVDAATVSFHKIHGPPGVGALIICKKFVEGFRLNPLIFGSQNGGMRGGTENLPGLGASRAALTLSTRDRGAKTQKVTTLREYVISALRAKYPCADYADGDYRQGLARQGLANTRRIGADVQILRRIGADVQPPTIVFLSPRRQCLAGTILLSVIGPNVCNQEIKHELEAAGIVISVGSACNTASKLASHVLYAMGCDKIIRQGALRISIGDDNTVVCCDRAVKALCAAITRQLAKTTPTGASNMRTSASTVKK